MQCFEEFLMENYGITVDEYDVMPEYESRDFEIEYAEYVRHYLN